MEMRKVCMIVQDPMVKGGIAAVVNGYRGSQLEKDYQIFYVESYIDGGKFAKLLKAICAYALFLRVLIIKKPDLIHIHSSFGPSFYRKMPFIYMASLAKVPVINHIHGADFEEFYVRASKRKKRWIRKAYNRCAKLIALSAEWKGLLQTIVETEKIEIVENYSVIHYDALKDKLSRPNNKQVLFLGELGKRKGCYDIPDVVKKVSSAIPDVVFILCGAGSEADELAIKSLIKEKKLEANVVFPGWVRDREKDKVLRNADVFFLPSYNEGMPMSILDAMGYGLPIVSTNVGGIPKIVQNNRNGMCCNPGDVDGFSRAIIDLLENQDLCNSASKSSFEIVSERYSLERHISLIEEVYEKV